MLVYVVVAASVFAAGFAAGWKIDDWRHGAARAKALDDARIAIEAQAEVYDEASAEHERFREEAAVWAADAGERLAALARRPAHAVACLDDDGLREWRRIARGPQGAGEPAAEVPAGSAGASGEDR